MRFDKLTTKFQQAIADAQSLANVNDNGSIESIHLLYALLEKTEGDEISLLSSAGCKTQNLKNALNAAIQNLPKIESKDGEIGISRELNGVLNLTEKLALKQGDDYISTEMFLLILIEDKNLAGKLLREAGCDKETLKKSIMSVRGNEKVNSQSADGQREALKKYTLDLTERARQGKLDPVIGRDDRSEERRVGKECRSRGWSEQSDTIPERKEGVKKHIK